MQSVSGTVAEFQFVPDVIAKDGSSFVIALSERKKIN